MKIIKKSICVSGEAEREEEQSYKEEHDKKYQEELEKIRIFY